MTKLDCPHLKTAPIFDFFLFLSSSYKCHLKNFISFELWYFGKKCYDGSAFASYRWHCFFLKIIVCKFDSNVKICKVGFA